MAAFMTMHIGNISIISLSLKVLSTTFGARMGARARAQMPMIISMIVLLLAIARGRFMILISMIVSIKGMASGVRMVMILSMSVSEAMSSLYWDKKWFQKVSYNQGVRSYDICRSSTGCHTNHLGKNGRNLFLGMVACMHHHQNQQLLACGPHCICWQHPFFDWLPCNLVFLCPHSAFTHSGGFLSMKYLKIIYKSIN